MGMIGGELLYNSNRFIDLQGILPEAAIVMLDHQRRNPYDGFEQNTEAGKRLHEVAGWDKLIPESMPQYQLGAPAFRLASMPKPEVRLWSTSGFAGGIQPWWHHIGSMHEDRRQYRPPSRSSPGTRRTRTCSWTASSAPTWAWSGPSRTTITSAAPSAADKHDGALSRRGEGAEPARHHLRAAARRRDRRAVERHEGDRPAQHGRPERRPGRRHRGIRRRRRLGDRHRRDLDRQRVRRTRAATSRSARSSASTAARGAGAESTPSATTSRPTRGTRYLRLAPELRAGVYGSRDATAPDSRRASATRSSPGSRRPTPSPSAATCRSSRWTPAPRYSRPSSPTSRSTRPRPPGCASRAPISPRSPPARRLGRQARLVRRRPRPLLRAATSPSSTRSSSPTPSAGRSATASSWPLSGGHGIVTADLYRQPGRHVLHLNNRLLLSHVPGRQYDLVPVGPIEVRLRTGAPATAARLCVAGEVVQFENQGDEVVITVPQIWDHEVLEVLG